ncbi:MAG: porin [Myxococcales bacterium]|nr:porin [Myxococcales bacterium]MCB9751478.1 porin [Myxococcales bacterium]
MLLPAASRLPALLIVTAVESAGANPRVADAPTAVAQPTSSAPTPAPQAVAPAPEPAAPDADDSSRPIVAYKDDDGNLRFRVGERASLRLGGYAEVFYGYNFNQPSNGLTNYRAFDNRHNALTLLNLAIDTSFDSRYVSTRIALQAGHAPNTYYEAGEPSQPGYPGGAGSSDASLWRYLQQAYLTGHLPTRVPVDIDAGLFLSPMGPESLATRDNWSWSHSPMFFALPFYHAGIRAGVTLTPEHFLRFGVYNGWNNVVDNNKEKSMALEYAYTPSERASIGVVYFTGVERPDKAPEGRAWRHAIDLYAIVSLGRRVTALLRPTFGVEPNNFGVSHWYGGNVALRVRALDWLFFHARGSLLREVWAESADGVAAPIVSPTDWLAELTGTVDFRVADHLSVKLEYRHDRARDSVFFAGDVRGAGTLEDPYVPNADRQNTLTLGVAAYF